jgi:hypothetical protein
MKKNYLIWLIGGAALYFLTRKKETVTTTETTTSDVGNQLNDTPSVPNNAPATITQPAAPRVNPIVVDIRPNNAAVGTPPQIPAKPNKDKFSID